MSGYYVCRIKVLPQFVEVRSSGLAHQPEGLPSAEQAALALRIMLITYDHEEFITEWERKRL